jgi:hypothetical protein
MNRQDIICKIQELKDEIRVLDKNQHAIKILLNR